ncbi:MAG TPA: exodeoxyribonuclease VII large subunit [Pseudobacteroides sp.]|uniref:exodeoxyribonuclease VII large subunit n=1 Tax=Pseudobacteroides sp. TaxID=1968840 RepID=UPI002F94227C
MRQILTVSEINRYLKNIITKDILLSGFLVRGEISNYKNHYSGHMYFTLKDETSLIKCVMFRTYNSELKFNPENGMRVIIGGYISVFERDGQYQLYVESMQPDGIGALHLAFEQLKQKLEREGLFDHIYKKPLPLLPRAVGVVTSSTGAVLRDIINIIGRRYPNINIKVCPVAVQGEGAAKQISRAIDRFNKLCCVDVLILARGGGSLEELWAFNEEIVARSIFKSEIPVVSAIGHETDYTISDFVADLRAPTPSAAAEIVVPEKVALKNGLNNLIYRLASSLNKNLVVQKSRLLRLTESAAFKQPFDRVYQERMRLDILQKSLIRALQMNFSTYKTRFAVLAGKLDALSPLTIMARGYSIVKDKESGKVIQSVNDVYNGTELEINLRDGTVGCIVK